MGKEHDKLTIYCLIWDSHGNKLESPYFHVHLPELQFTKDPEDMNVVTGTGATLSVEAIGEDVRYQWYGRYGRGEYVLLSSGGPDLDIDAILTEPGNYYIYCVITDASGQTEESLQATVEVYDPIYIEEDITDVEVRNGEKVKLFFEVVGCDVDCQWYCKEPGSSSFVPLENGKSSYLSYPMTSSVYKRQLYCVATDSAGNVVTSSTVTASMDTSLELLGDCDVCNGDGNCNRCSGIGWYDKTYFNGYEHVTENVRCDSGVCRFGNCTGCGGDGWVRSKDNYVAGDANSDKRVNLADVLMILQYEAGWEVSPDSRPPTPMQTMLSMPGTYCGSCCILTIGATEFFPCIRLQRDCADGK